MADYNPVPPRSPMRQSFEEAAFDPYALGGGSSDAQGRSTTPQRSASSQHVYPPSPSPGEIGYLDDPMSPLTPPVAGFHSHLIRQSVASAGGSTVGGRDSSAWASRVSLHEERGLLPGAVASAGAADYGAGGLGATTPNEKAEPDTGFNPAAKGTAADGAAIEVGSVTSAAKTKKKKRPAWLLPAAVVGVLVIIAVAVGVGVSLSRKKGGSGSGDGGEGPDGEPPSPTETGPPKPVILVTGGDGSEVTMEDGNTKFIYNNSFGGFWYYDAANPMNGPTGIANTWTPPVNESWRWGTDRQNGVNLGGWLVLEPFISPAMYQPYYPNARDEWQLSQRLAEDTARGGLAHLLEEHYKTFVTEQDFANIAAAGLNWIRLPVPFWAIHKLEDEPFLEHVAWTYFVKAIVWARKYGLRINLDLHTVPGSQNGWNHSGRGGEVGWMNGPLGFANGQRALDIIRIYAEYICKPEVTDIVPMFGIMNEPRGDTIGEGLLKNFNYQAYTIIREIAGIGKGPVVSIFGGFIATSAWYGWLGHADRLSLDRHPYLIFAGAQTRDSPERIASQICSGWASVGNDMSQNFGMNSAGEWSAAINDCGLWINSVGSGADYDAQFGAGSCNTWNRWQNWTDARKTSMRNFVAANMDALGDWFFWTWRIGGSLDDDGAVMSPFWSYSLGWEQGWIPPNPREAAGECERLGYAPTQTFTDYDPWQTSGAGAALPATTTEAYPWPPAQMQGADSYAPTGAIPTLTATGYPLPSSLATFVPTMPEGGMHVPWS